MTKVVSGLLTLFGFILLTLSSLVFLPASRIWMWKATILATEYGHQIALLAWGGALLALRNFKRSQLAFFSCLAAGIILSLPLLSCHWMEAPLRAELDKVFPIKNSASLPAVSSADITPTSYVYAKPAGKSLALDFYPARNHTHAPCVLIIHGGGWDGGDRTQLSPLNSWLAARGFAVASIDYRLAPESKWPAPREDALAALEYLKKNSASLQIDPRQFIILGRSAGGQIAEQLAYSAHDPTIRGVVAFYSPADLNFAYRYSSPDDILDSPSLLKNYLGGTPADQLENYNDASAIRFVTPDSPPTLLLHGARDELVWVRQSDRLAEVLKRNHVPYVFVRYRFATHGFDYNLKGPSGKLSLLALEQFLKSLTH